MQPVDIVILANGPGEVATWVRPTVRSLRRQLGDDRASVRISLILSPCPHATGKEAAIARSYPQIDRVQDPQNFWPFLLSGKTAESWEWRSRGVVLFLGGDQFFTLVVAKRLGYRSIIYAEWEARWVPWVDRFALMKPEIGRRVRAKYRPKLTTIGDLIAEVAADVRESPNVSENNTVELIGLLPGSKPAKLAQGVPLCLAIAEILARERPQTHFVIPVAPSLDLDTIARFADPARNPLLSRFGTRGAQLERSPEGEPQFLTETGVRIRLHTASPAYDLLVSCRLCLTTVGANTAELGALGVPMLVLLPTQQLDAMRAWDGLPGLLANLPLVGTGLAKIINGWVLRQGRLFAWPNIWANREIVPELVGVLEPSAVAREAIALLEDPERLEQMRDRLKALRGKAGAADALATVVRDELEKTEAN
jgi:hypothetical protein